MNLDFIETSSYGLKRNAEDGVDGETTMMATDVFASGLQMPPTACVRLKKATYPPTQGGSPRPPTSSLLPRS